MLNYLNKILFVKKLSKLWQVNAGDDISQSELPEKNKA